MNAVQAQVNLAKYPPETAKSSILETYSGFYEGRRLCDQNYK